MAEKQQTEQKLTVEEAHKAFAPGLFNLTWQLLEKSDRTDEESEHMVNTAHASLYHWTRIGKPINKQRGEWMLAHVYTILERKWAALHYAERTWRLTEEQKLDDFDFGYGAECYARALALNGQMEEAAKYKKIAEDAAGQIKKDGDRKQYESDLKNGPWFGLE